MSRLSFAAALLLAALTFVLAPFSAHAVRDLKQIDSSLRQETVQTKMLKTLRNGGTPQDAAANLGSFGKSNFEKSADLHTVNNLNQNLARYSKATDNGARGAVAARQFGKLAKNYDGDTEDFVNFAQQAAQKNLRLQMVRAAREQGK